MHHPLAQLLDQQYTGHESDVVQPYVSASWRGAEQRIATRRVVDQQQQYQFKNNPVPDQAVAAMAAAECGQAGMAAIGQLPDFGACAGLEMKLSAMVWKSGTGQISFEQMLAMKAAAISGNSIS